METDFAAMEQKIRRFSTGRIFEHWIHVASFLVLICTGLSQRYYSLDWSQWMILALGGIDNVRLIHRLAGAVFCIEVTIHLAIAAYGIIYRKWPLTMIITRKDFTDIALNIRYYLNLEVSPARSGRYSYKQKFEYWAILSGILLMMLTGLVLWFPAAVTAFLPGEIIPAAKVLHANEALVVFIIIAIWHVYNAVFSPDVFPLDTTIFTGYISKQRMLREHPEEVVSTEIEPAAPNRHLLGNPE